MFGGSERKEMIKKRREIKNKKCHIGWYMNDMEKRVSTHSYPLVKHMEYVT